VEVEEEEDDDDVIGAVEWIWVINRDCWCDTDCEDDDDDIEVGRSFFMKLSDLSMLLLLPIFICL
jgi:hypothetical protein